MTIQKTILASVFIVLISIPVYAQPAVSAEIDAARYQVGEEIAVTVTAGENPGFKSIFFDMKYDDTVLAFEGLEKGDILTDSKYNGQFLHAHSDPATSTLSGSYVAVSFLVDEDSGVNPLDGDLMTLHFRVTGQESPNQDYMFSFDAAGMYDGNNQPVQVAWNDSGAFFIGADAALTFISIRDPYENQVFYEDEAFLTAFGTQSIEYYALVENLDAGTESGRLSVASGLIAAHPVPLVYGSNRIRASLYDSNGNLLASDTVLVHRSTEDMFVQITHPADHSLVNSDMVDVFVKSPLSNVEVNGMPAEFTGEMSGDAQLYHIRIWLREGFNTIKAEAWEAGEEIRYTDSIELYYKKSNAIFRFLLPLSGEYFKPAETTSLTVKGEIDSLYKPGQDAGSGEPEKNRVSLTVKYKPYDRTKDILVLVNDQDVPVIESYDDYDDAKAQFVFYNDFPIPLGGLSNGEIEIIAYRNKENRTWEDEIHRVVYIDDNRLWIDLIQPNIFSSDVLDSGQKIKTFQGSDVISEDNSVTLSNDGAFVLAASAPVMKDEGITGVADMIETPRGTLYALSNSMDGRITIWKREPGESGWLEVNTFSGLYGYTLCSTELGLLIGTSHLFSNDNSGLYLLEDETLTNIRFPFDVKHVQFIENRNGTISLYGNYYTSLYSFDIFSMTEQGGAYHVSHCETTRFPNTFNIRQFYLSEDTTTAVIRNDADEVFFYHRSDSGYYRATLPGVDDTPYVYGTYVVPGEYEIGEYTCYLIPDREQPGEQPIEIIMEAREEPRRFFRVKKSFDELVEGAGDLVAAGFTQDEFVFLSTDGTGYTITNGQVFFGEFYSKGDPSVYELLHDIDFGPCGLFTSSNGSFFAGAGTYLSDSITAGSLYSFNRQFRPTGSARVHYFNNAIDGITGFSFEADPRWIQSEGAVSFGFHVMKQTGELPGDTDPATPVSLDMTALEEFCKAGNSYYTVTRHYDAAIGREIVHVEFAELQQEKYLTFDMALAAVGSAGPELHNLTIYKKTWARLCYPPDTETILPITGYVYDKTVDHITVQGDPAPLGRDGAFHYDLKIHTSNRSFPVTLECSNGNETVILQFLVEIIETLSGIREVTCTDPDTGADISFPHTMIVPSGSLPVTGKYFGLEGALVGYEIYQESGNTPVLIKQGSFEKVKDESVFEDFGYEAGELGTGFEAGTFTQQPITLVPGEQQVIIYCENPGGGRVAYMVDEEIPVVTYNMPPEEQEIQFLLPGDINEEVEGITITKTTTIRAYESAGAPYTFSCTYEIAGWVKSLYSFSDLLVKSFTDGLLFENNQPEMLIRVDSANRFSFSFTVTMDQSIAKDFYIGVVPTVPFLNNLKRGVKIRVKKSFEQTNFVPDFSPMHPDDWTTEEKDTLKVPIRFTLNRDDIPMPGMTECIIIVNHGAPVYGWVDVLDQDLYCLRTGENAPVELPDIKQGRNRVQWVFRFHDTLDNGNTTICDISSSGSGRPGMSDFLFDYYNEDTSFPTDITFSEDLTCDYYDAETLPTLELSKDRGIELEVTENNTAVAVTWEDAGENGQTAQVSLCSDAVKQGKNSMVVRYKEKLMDWTKESFTFLYDSLPPEAAVSSVLYSKEWDQVTDLHVEVREANFSEALLYHGQNIINRVPDIIIRGEDQYTLVWSGIGLDIGEEIKAEVRDLAGRNSFAVLDVLDGDVVRPEDTDVQDVEMVIPLYDGSPVLVNEVNYEEGQFPEHGKFAPGRFLERHDVLAELEDAGRYLVHNLKTQKIVASDGEEEDWFGLCVAIEGNTAIIGSLYEDDNGSDAGTAYIFERNNEGIWIQTQKILASDGEAGDQFGSSVALTENHAVIGARSDDDNGNTAGAAYIFERNNEGIWIQTQKLLAGDGETGDHFGDSVSLSENHAVIGACYNDDNGHWAGAAYIFERNNEGIWIEKQKILAGDGEAWNLFGASVALTENHAAIGASSFIIPGVSAGAVYIFERNNEGIWIEKQKILASDGEAGDQFGSSVALTENHAVIGAIWDDDNGNAAGAAYIFERNDEGIWIQKQKLLASDGEANDYFGFSIALSENHTVIGAHCNDDNGSNAGAAYVFERNNEGIWIQTQKLLASDGEAGDLFGISVALSENHAVISALHDDANGTDAGSAYIYNNITNPDQSAYTTTIMPYEDYGTHLIFTVPKNPATGFTTLSQFQGTITFEVTGIQQYLPEMTIEEVSAPAFNLAEEAYKYIEGKDHFYYITDITGLEQAFDDACELLPLQFGNPDYLIIDRGFLRVNYNNITPSRVDVVNLTGPGNTDIHDIPVYDLAYEDPAPDPGNGYMQLHPDLIHDPVECTTLHDEDAGHLTLWFHIRPEDEEQDELHYHRVLTFSDAQGDPVLGLDYRGEGINMYNCETGIYLFESPLNSLVPYQWDFIAVQLNNTDQSLRLYCNDTFIQTDPGTLDADIASLLVQNAQYTFGPIPGNEYNTGFYSIAEPMYTNKLLSDNEIYRLYKIENKGFHGEVVYEFPDNASDFGEEKHELRMHPEANGGDYFAPDENAGYDNALPDGSFKASSLHSNLLKVIEQDAGEHIVVFADADACVPLNMDVRGHEDSFTLTPTTETGRYYFGDRAGNYSFRYDHYYTVSGTVASIPETETEAYLVLRINGEEQRLRLYEGPFTFLYGNTHDLVPEEVRMYIETNGAITLTTDLMCHEGNYILPRTLEKTAATTLFPYGLTGTVCFWYKPMMTNREGFWSYPLVFFDSELLKIGADVVDDCAEVYVRMKNEGGSTAEHLETHCKVTAGWQHFQVSWSYPDKLLYFYVNGMLAAKREGAEFTLPEFSSLVGEVPDTDNIVTGCDLEGEVFAEGYIDRLTLSSYYEESLYDDITPLRLFYDEETASVDAELTGITTDEINVASWQLETAAGHVLEQGTTWAFPFNVSSYPGGRYCIRADFLINNKKFSTSCRFNREAKPKFELAKTTPVIFRNSGTPLFFSFTYDRSYKFESDRLEYDGIALRIDTDGDGTGDYTGYIVQDFSEADQKQWLEGHEEEDGSVFWVPLDPGNGGLLTSVFPGIHATADVGYACKYFTFTNTFGPEQAYGALPAPDLTGVIPLATIVDPPAIITDSAGYEYKMKVEIGGVSIDDVWIDYYIYKDQVVEKSGNVPFPKNSGYIDLYYDDILPFNGEIPVYGVYFCTLKLRYYGVVYAEIQDIVLNWEEKKEIQTTIDNVRDLKINEFSLLALNTMNDTASFYIAYHAEGVGSITGELDINGDIYPGHYDFLNTQSFAIIEDVSVPRGISTVRITLQADGFMPQASLQVNNQARVPEVLITNTVDSRIAYNTVYFSWKGLYDGEFHNEIEYKYDLDSAGWSSYSSQWRSVRFYNLEDGQHQFRVMARYRGAESIIYSVPFFVDVHKPVFRAEKITIEKVYDDAGICYAANIRGDIGAVDDASLKYLVSGETDVVFLENGRFDALLVPLPVDGVNNISFTAIDSVGNTTDYTISIENSFTEFIYPAPNSKVVYAPMVVVGKISPDITCGMDIYLSDPYTLNVYTKEDQCFENRKKAIINADRTFFIEDVFVNPGTESREILTALQLAVVFDSGKVFTKELSVRANRIMVPIDMEVSTHAVEGGKAGTTVNIDCLAHVVDISSWSVDYNGDGIYDEVDIDTSQSHRWTHTYSNIGKIKVRVRVVVKSGAYFSTFQEIIIHEEIKEPTCKTVTAPVSFAVLRDNQYSTTCIYILREEGIDHVIDKYPIPDTTTAFPTNTSLTVDLYLLGINDPVKICATGDDRLLVAANPDNSGVVYEIFESEMGNWEKGAIIRVEGIISGITAGDGRVIISFNDRSDLAVLTLQDTALDPGSLTYITPEVAYSQPPGTGTGIAINGQGFLMADRENRRVLRFSHKYRMIDYFGTTGTGEAEFLFPTLITAKENRIAVYDPYRADIQVFDGMFNPVCTLGYNPDPDYANYLAPEFFQDIAGIKLISREEMGRLYYYILMLSRTSGKCAFLRLPQWEEMQAQVRNNKIVFIRDGEVFTAKPDGADLEKVISSDSLPRIEGTLDYPALSPDGRTLGFTARTELYNGQAGPGTDEPYVYDNIYTVDIETDVLRKITPSLTKGFAIERPVFNSNGDTIIYSARPGGENWQIYTCQLEDGTGSRLFVSPENARFPYYSPDDRFVVFTTDYDGDEDIQIVDTANVNKRAAVTQNNARDSYPVWNTLYPYEISNPDSKIESKIAYVSERNYHKNVYSTYIARFAEDSVRVVTSQDEDVGHDPDSAAFKITSNAEECEYPAFTGDGVHLVYEYSDRGQAGLEKYCYLPMDESAENPVIMHELGRAARPAGMKNMITNFKAENINGNELALSWDPYTESDIRYIVQFKPNRENAEYAEEYVYYATNTTLTGLEMGQEYILRVCIIENDVEATSSKYIITGIPEVAARPSYTIDENNPYLVKLHAWQPEDAVGWKFTWVIDNQDYNAGQSRDYWYEYATSGPKTVMLKVSNADNTETQPAPVRFTISSDIVPVIEYTLPEDRKFIELSCEHSLGTKIDFSSALWTITGPAGNPIQISGTPRVYPPIDEFEQKICVNLQLRRLPVNNQAATDTIEKSMDIDIGMDLDFIFPVIAYTPSQADPHFITFNADQSKGNIDWYRARWTIFENGSVIHREEGTSAFDYQFRERNTDTLYTVTLSVPAKDSGESKTVSQVIDIQPAPVEPKIAYEIITIEENENITGAKLLLDCTKSRGSTIDFTQARWSVPVAGNYGEQPTQFGPTALYTLPGIAGDAMIDVSLTLSRQGGIDPLTVTEAINLNKNDLFEFRVIVTETIEQGTEGKVVVLDVLKSTGPNIDWEKTDWLIDGNYARKGPVVRVDVPESGEKKTVHYVCTLYRYGQAQPALAEGTVNIEQSVIIPLISYSRLSSAKPNYFELSVLDTKGPNIDWERTTWYIYDGNEGVVIRQGSGITHGFALSSEQMGYPVMAEMFFKGSSYPFVGYTTIDVEGDELMPIITYVKQEDKPNVVTFSAVTSKGSNIDWNQAKWTFGDSSESQYGPTVVHEYTADKADRTYRVSLTLTRRSVNGNTEAKTATLDINLARDQIRAVVKAALYEDYLVLSAEESEGSGLVLDRSVWMFAGEGDSVSETEHVQSGVISRDVSSVNTQAGMEFGIELGPVVFKLSRGVGISYSHEETDYSDYTDETSSFSTSNYHTGAVCRRYIPPGEKNKNLYVTLFVYRMTKTGEVQGESITVKFIPDDARTSAGSQGVVYGK